MKNRLENELEHGRKLASEGAEDIWNWASPAGQKRADRRADYFVSVGKIRSTDKVLEIGCGTGLFTRKVRSLTGANITATDISQELLDIARKTLPVDGITYMLDDATSMSFPDESFDVVFGSSILHHLDFDKSLSEIFRVLKVGGRMVFAEPNMLNPQIFIQKNVPFIKKALGDSPDETAIVRWAFTRKMESLGFNKVKIFPYDFLHPATPIALVPFVDKLSRIVDKVPVIREIAGSTIIYGTKTSISTDSLHSIDRHNIEMQENLEVWNKKPLLREIYKSFYQLISQHINRGGKVIEIGSGIGKFKEFYPEAISTDIFKNPWIDEVESAYALSHANNSLATIVLIDVFHHLIFPGQALKEFHRTLQKGGRVIILEPYVSLFGVVVFGMLHKEGISIFRKIRWMSNGKEDPNAAYYAGQGNATRIFSNKSAFKGELLADWNIVTKKKYSALSYILSGGFSKPAFYSMSLLPVIRKFEKFLDLFPILFATRMLVVLEKK